MGLSMERFRVYGLRPAQSRCKTFRHHGFNAVRGQLNASTVPDDIALRISPRRHSDQHRFQVVEPFRAPVVKKGGKKEGEYQGHGCTGNILAPT